MKKQNVINKKTLTYNESVILEALEDLVDVVQDMYDQIRTISAKEKVQRYINGLDKED